jgi:hypothetical protein
MCGIRHVNNEPPCSDVLCPWLWKIWQLLNTKIHCVYTIHGGGYWPHIRRFERKDYVYLQQTTLITLDVTIGRVILCV